MRLIILCKFSKKSVRYFKHAGLIYLYRYIEIIIIHTYELTLYNTRIIRELIISVLNLIIDIQF